MEFEKFSELLVQELRGCYEEDTEIHIGSFLKNNGVRLQSVTIVKKGERISPNIYLDEFYLKYNKGEMSSVQIAEKIVQQRERIVSGPELNIGYTWDAVKDKVFCKVVNKEKNLEKLSTMPHIEYLDLAVTVRVLYRQDGGKIASTEVDYSLLRMLGISEEQLFEQANKNTEILFPVKIKSLADTIAELLDAPEDFRELLCDATTFEMYVLSNDTGLNGATSMLYNNVLRSMAEKLESDELYILPSSIHECMVISGNDDIGFMKNMLVEANMNAVCQIDFLSDHVYRYDREKNIVEIAA